MQHFFCHTVFTRPRTQTRENIGKGKSTQRVKIYDFFLQDTYRSLRDTHTKKSDFLQALERKSVAYSKQHNWKGFVPADEILLACALSDDVITSSHDVFATVEIKGEFTWGQMVVDWNSVLKKPSNLKLVTDVDSSKYLDLLYQAVDRSPPKIS